MKFNESDETVSISDGFHFNKANNCIRERRMFLTELFNKHERHPGFPSQSWPISSHSKKMKINVD